MIAPLWNNPFEMLPVTDRMTLKEGWFGRLVNGKIVGPFVFELLGNHPVFSVDNSHWMADGRAVYMWFDDVYGWQREMYARHIDSDIVVIAQTAEALQIAVGKTPS